ncbi:MAG: STAS domain-containing protein [Steroidobacteraceae bacterium]
MNQPLSGLSSLGQGRWILSGDLLFDNAAVLLDEGTAAFGADARAEIDLARVRRVDSAGLALLVEWSIAARGSGRAVTYRNVPPVLGALAGISDLAQFLESA